LVPIQIAPSGASQRVRGSTRVLRIGSGRPPGQAGSSSNIENYLGFPTGISGRDLAERAYAQAQKFGANVMMAKGATELAREQKPFGVSLDDGTSIRARTVIIATGAAGSWDLDTSPRSPLLYRPDR
jgi:thioredoxin reductase (NADPH)